MTVEEMLNVKTNARPNFEKMKYILDMEEADGQYDNIIAIIVAWKAAAIYGVPDDIHEYMEDVI